jgi:integrase
MCKAAGIPGLRSNHSMRTTSTTGVYAAGINEQLIMEHTGHRSVEGVRSYKRTYVHQEEGTSDVLT